MTDRDEAMLNLLNYLKGSKEYSEKQIAVIKKHAEKISSESWSEGYDEGKSDERWKD